MATTGLGSGFIESIYAPDTIVKLSIPVDKLCYSFEANRTGSKGQLMDLVEARRLAGLAREAVFADYHSKTGQNFDSFRASQQDSDDVRLAFRANPNFSAALELLEIEAEQASLITLPWWNEIAGGERSFEFTDGCARLVLQERHSYETQLMRAGIERPVHNASVMGVVLTAPDPETDERQLVMGIRGGKSYPNTFHVTAGALKVTDSIRTGQASIFSIFLETELRREMGLGCEDLTASQVAFRIFDRQLDKGPAYVFSLQTSLSADEIRTRWENNPKRDKDEHNQLIFLPAEPDGILAFIERYYRGAVENRQQRGDDERYLLHPSALILAGLIDMTPEALRAYRHDGTW